MKSLLLIPGVLCNNRLWEGFAALNRDNFNAYYADIPTQLTISGMSREVLERAPKRFWAVGFSLGGWIALEAAHLNPEAIEGLILISTTGGELLASARASMEEAIRQMRKGHFQNYIDQSPDLYLTPQHSQDPILNHKLKNMMQEVGFENAITQYGALLKVEKPFTFLDKITCPTLVIRGHEDKRHTLEMDQSLQKQIPNAKLITIENSAHFVPMEQPAALFNTIEEFTNEF